MQEAIEARHSVRAYKDLPLSEEIVKLLEDELVKLNNEGQLHIQLICNEPKAFQGTMAKYGKFRNANNYLVMAGKKAEDLDERIGYYGEHLVLLAQTLGLTRENVMAVGDAGNDLSMLEYAFHSVAMGNATKDVLACCRYVTASNDECGVAQIIEHVIASQEDANG